MKLLLDTHIWLWSLLEHERLSRRVRNALARTSTEIWLSPISVWEALILAERGRLDLSPDAETWLADARAVVPTIEAPITMKIAEISRRVDVAHQDPADRFLAATASVLDLTLVTQDARLLAGTGYATMSNA